jgi:hypothetical protein
MLDLRFQATQRTKPQRVRREKATKLGQAARMKRSALFVLLGLAATSAAAQAPATGSATVAGVEVTAVPPPAIVATFPAQDGAVAPGVLVLKVAFDQRMQADAWSYAPLAGTDDPKCLGVPRLLSDDKTFVLLCTVEAGKTYGVGINQASGKAFVDRGGRKPPPMELRFNTTAAEPVRTVKAAMTAAGLDDLDSPVESLGAYVRPASN